MVEKRYFIKKNFIGYPIEILSGTYMDGVFLKGDFDCPRTLKKFKGFGSLEQLRKFRMCSCGKTDCYVNHKLKRILNDKYGE